MRSWLISAVLLLATCLVSASPFLTHRRGAFRSGVAVTYDTYALSASTSGTSTSVTDFTLTMGSVTNGAVIVAVNWRGAVPSGVTVTVGGNSATLITSTSGAESTFISSALYGVAMGTTSGAKTVSISWTGAVAAQAAAVSFGNVNQTTPFDNGAFTSYAFGVSSHSMNITTESGDATFDFSTDRSSSEFTSESAVSIFDDSRNTDGLRMSSSYVLSTGTSNTHSREASVSGGDRGTQSGCNINAG